MKKPNTKNDTPMVMVTVCWNLPRTFRWCFRTGASGPSFTVTRPSSLTGPEIT